MKKLYILLLFLIPNINLKNLPKIKNRNRKLKFYKHPAFITPVSMLGILTAGHYINKTNKGQKFFHWLNTKKPALNVQDKVDMENLLVGMDSSNYIHNDLKLTESKFQILQSVETDKLSNIRRLIGECEQAFNRQEEKLAKNMNDLKDNGVGLAGLINRHIHGK